MKQILMIPIILLLSMSFMNASKFFNLESFKEQPIQTILLHEKDAVVFDYKQGRHAIVFEKFNTNEGIDLSMFVYQSSYNLSIDQSANFVSLKPGMRTLLDFDRDYINDMEITYVRQIKQNATLKFASLNQSDIDIINPSPDYGNSNTKNKKPDLITGLMVIAGILIIGLVIFFVFAKMKKKPHS